MTEDVQCIAVPGGCVRVIRRQVVNCGTDAVDGVDPSGLPDIDGPPYACDGEIVVDGVVIDADAVCFVVAFTALMNP